MPWWGKDTFSVARDAITEKAMLDTYDSLQQIVDSAFEKCVEPRSVRGPSMRPFRGESAAASDSTKLQQQLTDDERACVEEYTILFTKYSQKAFDQFNKGYERMAREAMAKMRQMEAMQRAKGDMKSM